MFVEMPISPAASASALQNMPRMKRIRTLCEQEMANVMAEIGDTKTDNVLTIELGRSG